MKKLFIVSAILYTALVAVAAAQFTPSPTDVKLVNGAAPPPAICSDEKKRVGLNIDLTASTTTIELVSLASGNRIYVCDVLLFVGGASKLTFVSGHGALCVTGETPLSTPDPAASGDGWVEDGGGYLLFNTVTADALCLKRANSVTARGRITYVQQVPPP